MLRVDIHNCYTHDVWQTLPLQTLCKIRTQKTQKTESFFLIFYVILSEDLLNWSISHSQFTAMLERNISNQSQDCIFFNYSKTWHIYLVTDLLLL